MPTMMVSNSPAFVLPTNAAHSSLLNSSVGLFGFLLSRTATPIESRATSTQVLGLFLLHDGFTKSESRNRFSGLRIIPTSKKKNWCRPSRSARTTLSIFVFIPHWPLKAESSFNFSYSLSFPATLVD